MRDGGYDGRRIGRGTCDHRARSLSHRASPCPCPCALDVNTQADLQDPGIHQRHDLLAGTIPNPDRRSELHLLPHTAPGDQPTVQEETLSRERTVLKLDVMPLVLQFPSLPDRARCYETDDSEEQRDDGCPYRNMRRYEQDSGNSEKESACTDSRKLKSANAPIGDVEKLMHEQARAVGAQSSGVCRFDRWLAHRASRKTSRISGGARVRETGPRAEIMARPASRSSRCQVCEAVLHRSILTRRGALAFTST
jgi:hypothetical protein